MSCMKKSFSYWPLKTNSYRYTFGRSNHWRCSLRKCILRNFSTFTGEHLCQNLFCNFIKKRLWHRCFLVNFAKFLRTYFFQNISGRLLLFRGNQAEGFALYLQKQKLLTSRNWFQRNIFHTLLTKNVEKKERKTRSNRPEVFLGKGVPKISSKFTE